MLKVQCPNCKKLCHETTDTYDPAIRANGGMVNLLDPWKTWGWGKFGDHRNGGAEIIASDMDCPCCEAPLAPSGRLTVLSDQQVKTKEQKGTEQVVEMFASKTTIGDEAEATVERALPFLCSACGKVCKSQAGLVAHERAHKNA